MNLQTGGENSLTQRSLQWKMFIICNRTERTLLLVGGAVPSDHSSLVTRQWMYVRGSLVLSAEYLGELLAFPDCFKFQLCFCECERSSSSQRPLRGLTRLVGLQQAAGFESGYNGSNGRVMFSWPRAQSDLDSTGA